MAAAPVVCNASPLIALEQTGQLRLLKELFGEVVVPSAVAAEVAPTVSLPEWIEQRELQQPIGPVILQASLGRGESAAISLALEIDASLIILDDRPARRLAQSLNLPIIGTLGVLLAAKRQGLISAIKPHLDGLLQHDFYITPRLYRQVLLALLQRNVDLLSRCAVEQSTNRLRRDPSATARARIS